MTRRETHETHLYMLTRRSKSNLILLNQDKKNSILLYRRCIEYMIIYTIHKKKNMIIYILIWLFFIGRHLISCAVRLTFNYIKFMKFFIWQWSNINCLTLSNKIFSSLLFIYMSYIFTCESLLFSTWFFIY